MLRHFRAGSTAPLIMVKTPGRPLHTDADPEVTCGLVEAVPFLFWPG